MIETSMSQKIKYKKKIVSTQHDHTCKPKAPVITRRRLKCLDIHTHTRKMNTIQWFQFSYKITKRLST